MTQLHLLLSLKGETPKMAETPQISHPHPSNFTPSPLPMTQLLSLCLRGTITLKLVPHPKTWLGPSLNPNSSPSTPKATPKPLQHPKRCPTAPPKFPPTAAAQSLLLLLLRSAELSPNPPCWVLGNPPPHLLLVLGELLGWGGLRGGCWGRGGWGRGLLLLLGPAQLHPQQNAQRRHHPWVLQLPGGTRKVLGGLHPEIPIPKSLWGVLHPEFPALTIPGGAAP